MPAPHNIMCAAVEGAQVDIDNAAKIETRYFVDLVVGQVSKNMINAFFFDMQNDQQGRRRAPRATRSTRPARSSCSAPG